VRQADLKEKKCGDHMTARVIHSRACLASEVQQARLCITLMGGEKQFFINPLIINDIQQKQL